MKPAGTLLAPLLLAGLVWVTPPQARPGRQQAVAAPSTACVQEWKSMAQRQREEADAVLKDSAGLRAMLVMLRNDAGTISDSSIRNGLQVNADMWETALSTLQRQAANLQMLAQQEEAKAPDLCRAR
jgi:hypothetical protein